MAFDPLESHPVKQSLKSLLAFEGNSKLSAKNESIDEEQVWNLERIFYVANDVSLILKDIGDLQVNRSALDALNNGLNKAVEALNQFLSDANVAHINTARSQMDKTVLQNLRNAIPVGFEVHPRTEAALASYRKRAQKANQALKTRNTAATNMLNELETQINNKQSELDALKTSIEEEQQRVSETETELKTADAERAQKQAEKFTGLLEELRGKADAAEANLIEAADTSLKSIGDKEEEARKIVQSVGDILTTGTYADRASKESSMANNYRLITIGLFTFGLLIIVSNYIIYAVGAAIDANVSLAESWQSLAARLATGIAVALPAIYTAKESARHRTNADMAKQRELELTTLGPFIELLPDDQKTIIRDRLTDRYFGNEAEKHDYDSPLNIDKLLTVVENISKSQ